MAASTADVTRSRAGLLAWTGLPGAIVVVSPPLFESPRAPGFIWASAFALMGVRCLWNARTCHRTHGDFTGPWFLLASLASLTLGWTAADSGMRESVGAAAAIGAALLWFRSERLFGKDLERDGNA